MLPATFTFSQSSLQDYADCPRRFQLRYIDQMTWPAVESEPVAEFELRQAEGLVFHRLVQQHLLGLRPEKLTEQANTPSLARWWRNYLSANVAPSDSALRPEIILHAFAGRHRLIAKYDLVAVKSGQALIFDWKTSARRPRDEWLAARWQTRVYRALMARAGAQLNAGRPFEPNQIRMQYWFAEYPDQTAEFSYDAGQFGRDWSAIETLIREISAAEAFPLTDDRKACSFCIYRSYCDRGASAGEGAEPEAEPGAGDEFDLNFEQVGEIEY